MFRQSITRTTWKLKPPVLALGGGGARGFAHLGVLQVLWVTQATCVLTLLLTGKPTAGTIYFPLVPLTTRSSRWATLLGVQLVLTMLQSFPSRPQWLCWVWVLWFCVAGNKTGNTTPKFFSPFKGLSHWRGLFSFALFTGRRQESSASKQHESQAVLNFIRMTRKCR